MDDLTAESHACHFQLDVNIARRYPFHGSPVTLAVYVCYLAVAHKHRVSTTRGMAIEISEHLGLGAEACRKHLRVLHRSGWFVPKAFSDPADSTGRWSEKAPNAAGVYAVYGDDQLLYVGQSGSIQARLAMHSGSAFADRATDWAAWLDDDGWRRTQLELAAIAQLRPKFNVQGSTR